MPLSRSDVPSDTREHFENLELKFGSKIVPIKSDISSTEGLKHLEEKLNGLPSIAGIVNSAGILDDKMFMEIDRQSYREVMASKVNGKNLPIFYKRSSSLSHFSSRKVAVIREDAGFGKSMEIIFLNENEPSRTRIHDFSIRGTRAAKLISNTQLAPPLFECRDKSIRVH